MKHGWATSLVHSYTGQLFGDLGAAPGSHNLDLEVEQSIGHRRCAGHGGNGNVIGRKGSPLLVDTGSLGRHQQALSANIGDEGSVFQVGHGEDKGAKRPEEGIVGSHDPGQRAGHLVVVRRGLVVAVLEVAKGNVVKGQLGARQVGSLRCCHCE